MNNKAILRNLGIVFMLVSSLAFASGVASASGLTITNQSTNTVDVFNGYNHYTIHNVLSFNSIAYGHSFVIRPVRTQQDINIIHNRYGVYGRR